MKKQILYIDMDGVVADYDKAALNKTQYQKSEEGFFQKLEPVDGAIDAINLIYDSDLYDYYFLSTAPWSNPNAWKEKRIWLEEHFHEDVCFKRLILSHNKSLLRGHFLIDDRLVNGVEEFQGIHIHFGSSRFPSWQPILNYLLPTI